MMTTAGNGIPPRPAITPRAINCPVIWKNTAPARLPAATAAIARLKPMGCLISLAMTSKRKTAANAFASKATKTAPMLPNDIARKSPEISEKP